MKLKSIFALSLAIMLLLGLAAPALAASGGWTVNAEAGSYLTSAERRAFARATEGLSGAVYAPVFTLARQAVAGTNYAFLCASTTATARPVAGWKVLFVYKALDGACELMGVKNVNIARPRTRQRPYAQPTGAGAWAYNDRAVASRGVPAAAKRAFNRAAKGYAGVSLTPLALLGTQAVAGRNYRFLCRGVAADATGTACLYVVTVYKDLAGQCAITDCDVFNLPAYLKY